MHPMKQALRMRRARDIHTIMTPAEDRESLGLAPDGGHDISHGSHGGEHPQNMEMAHHLMQDAHSMHAGEPMEETEEDLALNLMDQAHDDEGKTMPHSGNVETSHDEGHKPKSKARSIKDAAAEHMKHKGM